MRVNSVLFTIHLAPLNLGIGGHLGFLNLLMSGRCIQILLPNYLCWHFLILFIHFLMCDTYFSFYFYKRIRKEREGGERERARRGVYGVEKR